MKHLRPTLAGVALLMLAACSGSKGQTVSGPSSISPDSAGTVTITSSSPIQNQNGKFLLVFAQAERQSSMVARACIPITADSFMVSSTPMAEMSASGNPCDSAITTKSFGPGRYELIAGIYSGGSQTPERTVRQSFQVSGNVSLVVDATGLGG